MLKMEMEQAEAVWSSMSELNASLRTDLKEFQVDTAVLNAIYNELNVRKRDGMMRVWGLEDALKQVHDDHLTQWSEKEQKIGNFHEKIEELTIRLELKQHVLEDIASQLPVYEKDFNDQMYCDSAFRLQQAQSNRAFDIMMHTRCEAVTASNMHLPELGTAADKQKTMEESDQIQNAPIVSSELVKGKPKDENDKGNNVMIRDFKHLHQLKMYLFRKSESKKFGKSLKPAQKLGFKADIAKFSNTLVPWFATDDLGLDSYLGLTLLEITNLFVSVSTRDGDGKEQNASLKSFKRLLKKFLKKYPVESSKKPSFLQRLFENKQKKLDRDLTHHMDFLNEKIVLEEQFSDSLQKQLIVAEDKNDESRKYKSLMEGDMILLGMLLEDAEDNLRYDYESFQAQFLEQDAENSKLRQTAEDLEGNIELKDLSIQFLASKLNPVNDSGYFELDIEGCVAFTRTTDL